MPRLIVIKGADEGKQFELTGTGILGIGRDAGNPLRLHDTEVSRRHAEFHPFENGYRVLDVGSANGTFVNNQRLKEAVLRSGDHIQIGQTIMVFTAGRSGSQPASDLADKISMITRHDVELSSAIVKTINEAEGSRILARPDQAAGTVWLKSALANLGIMYETIQAVSHILDLDQLLERIMELVFRSISPDRGCIMLRHPDSGQFEPKAIRWREKVDHTEKFAISRTIMDYVLREKQGVLVADASRDERFNTGQSIVRFGIREVICVPMKGRHETLGVFYLDTHSNAREMIARNSPNRFQEDHLKLAIGIAHQAALAVEDTRYHHAMVQAERLAAIGQTIAALSHHIKNILQGVRFGSDLLKKGLAEKDEPLVQQGWKIVEKSQGKIYDLVMDMLSYSKDREPAFEDTNLNKLTEDVVEMMRGRAKEVNAKLETRLDMKMPLVPADPEGIHRSLLNCVTNALDAVEDRPNAQVVVTTSIEADTNAWARITVMDNGIGIPPHKLTEIFKPFVSTKGSKGTGLGLAVSRKILREHGGDILVQSTAGKGTRMTLRLPLKIAVGSSDMGATASEIPVVKQQAPPRPEGPAPGTR